MKTLIFDIEGNGLREDITKIWCIVTKDISTKEVFSFNLSTREDKIFIIDMISLFNSYDKLVGHNIIGYDFPILKKFYKLDLSDKIIHDTYVVSQTLNPDRQLPIGCPTSTPNPITGNKDKIGPHSLEAHGFRLGKYKIHHHDWTQYSPEMLERCKQDVFITEELYYDQLKELNLK